MHHTRHFLKIIAIVGLLCGCGQTGALYLPDRGRTTAPSAPAQTDSESVETEERQNRRGTEETPASDTESPATLPDPDRPVQTPQGPGGR